MKPEHYLSDLDEMIAGLAARQQRNVDAVKAADRDLTPEEELRFEVGWCMTRDLLADMRTMRDWWAKGHAMYRKTEKMLEDAG